MAPPSAAMAPKATPSPHRNVDAKEVRLNWGDAQEDNHPVVPLDEEDDGKEAQSPQETSYFEPAKFKFSLIFGVLVATLVVFLMIAGPPAMNIIDGNANLKGWQIVVICFGVLLVSILLGFFIEQCYRDNYVKHILNSKPKDEKKEAAAGEVEMTDKDKAKAKDKATEDDNKEKEKDEASKSRTVDAVPQPEQKEKAEEDEEDEEPKRFNNQDYFRLYLVIACGAVDFAQGGNDVANVLGPFGQIYKYVTTGTLEGEMTIPVYIAGAAGLTVALGFAIFGAPVLETIGKSITKLSFRSGFVAQFCSASTVLVCNVLGLPVSSSTVIVGGVSGVAMYNSKQQKKEAKANGSAEEEVEYVGCMNKMKYLWSNQKIRILCKILAIWIITIPANAIIAGCLFALINLAL